MAEAATCPPCAFDAIAHLCLSSFERTEEAWAAAHAASLVTARALAAAAQQPKQARHVLRPGASASSEAVMAEQLDELEAVVVALHDELGAARAELAAMSPAAAAHRGPHGLHMSAADRCGSLAAPLGLYEAALDMHRAAARSLASPLTAKQTAALLVAWETQPLLESLPAMRRGLEEQVRNERILREAGLDAEPAREAGFRAEPPPADASVEMTLGESFTEDYGGSWVRRMLDMAANPYPPSSETE